MAKLDGFLTDPSSRDPKDIALDYVRTHPDVFKLDEDDLAGLVLKRDYIDVAGVRHLMWAQTADGIPAFDNDLRANLTSDGRLINVLGSPLPDLEAPADPALGATDALGLALENVGRAARRPRVTARGTGAQQATRFAGGDRANLVLLNTGNGVELAWHVTATADEDEVYNSLVDASSGEVLRRANQVEEATGLAWDYFPSPTLPGGGATPRVFDAWLSATDRLFGPNAHVFRDLNDDNGAPDTGEEVGPSVGGNWSYSFTKTTPANGNCDGSPGGGTSACSWDGDVNMSWATPSLQNATQVFYFVNNFHDYLKADPGIGFGATSSEGFEGNDRVIAHAVDGANTGGFQFGQPNMPNADHLNNANMSTPPDGQSPTMQMYLFTWLNFGDSVTADANGGDDASVVYHEYTHGLSNRLVTYSNGVGALDAHQSGSMGEAWSDWYAMDYLVAQTFAPDAAADGDVLLGPYLGNGISIFRSQALDCPTTASGGNCGTGGYTYGDLGSICPCGPEVHADGEIWAQTLWDLRQHVDVGVAAARALVTEGMRLSPANPSFLDMRNAILQADTALGLGDRDHIWEVFANRGMGYFASSDHAGDLTPTPDTSLPPDPADGVGTVAGLVTDPNTGARVAGARVEIANLPDDLFDVTDSLGQYSIANVPVGTYPLLRATKSLYDAGEASGVAVLDGMTTAQNFQVRRDWAAYGGGARVSKFTGPNYSFAGCGPNGAIDQSLLTGWGSDDLGTRSITVKLPSFVDVTGFAVDPGATCGDAESASLADYRIEVSKNGTTFTQVKSGTFSSSNNHRLNFVSANGTRAGVRYVRLTMLSNQGADVFRDLSELSVYGKFRPACLGLAATRIGTEASNTINGTGGADVIVANGGNDKIYGKGGKDAICGGAGNDTIAAGPGLDRIDAGSGNDRVNTKDGVRERTIRGGSGTDRLRKDKKDRGTGFERRY